jgi:hypothetical protein
MGAVEDIKEEDLKGEVRGDKGDKAERGTIERGKRGDLSLFKAKP